MINIEDLHQKIIDQIKAFHIYDIPEGRHDELIDEFYKNNAGEGASLLEKLQFIWSNLHSFNAFLSTKERYKPTRLNTERQAKLEPERTEEAIKALNELGFDVVVVNKNEINFSYKGSLIKYFPYSQWASGKTINDGRGLNNLLKQLSTSSSV